MYSSGLVLPFAEQKLQDDHSLASVDVWIHNLQITTLKICRSGAALSDTTLRHPRGGGEAVRRDLPEPQKGTLVFSLHRHKLCSESKFLPRPDFPLSWTRRRQQFAQFPFLNSFRMLGKNFDSQNQHFLHDSTRPIETHRTEKDPICSVVRSKCLARSALLSLLGIGSTGTFTRGTDCACAGGAPGAVCPGVLGRGRGGAGGGGGATVETVTRDAAAAVPGTFTSGGGGPGSGIDLGRIPAGNTKKSRVREADFRVSETDQVTNNLYKATARNATHLVRSAADHIVCPIHCVNTRISTLSGN